MKSTDAQQNIPVYGSIKQPSDVYVPVEQLYRVHYRLYVVDYSTIRRIRYKIYYKWLTLNQLQLSTL